MLELIREIRDLYDRNLFLQAHARCGGLWNTPWPQTAGWPVEALVLGGRLAARLGGPRRSRRLFLEAARREPDHPQVRYFARYAQRRGADVLAVLRDIERRPDFDSGDPDLDASWWAGQAVTWSALRDFDRAEEALDRARALRPGDPWVLSCEADVRMGADRWEDALACAERAWAASRAPYAARSLGFSLMRCGRLDEAAATLATGAEAGESFEIAQLAIWYLCARAEQQEEGERRATAARAAALAGRLEALAPLADRESSRAFVFSRIDVADQAGDLEQLRKLAEQAGSPFYRRTLENIRSNPGGARRRLTHRRFLQNYETCLPTSMATVLSALGTEIDPVAIAAELTYRGTPMYAAAEWFRRRGFAVRSFVVTPGTAVPLLRAGLPFVMSLETESDAHAVAAVGLDEAAGTMFVHDPNSPREYEYLLDSLGEEEAPLGPDGLVAAPAGREGELDRLLPADSVAAGTALHDHHEAWDRHGPAAAAAVAESLSARFPGHPVARYLEALGRQQAGRPGEALALFQALMAEFPKCLGIRRALMGACCAMGNTALQREALETVVNRRLLPGVRTQQDWRHPPATYVCRFADLLRVSSDTRPQALRLLRGVLRRQPANAEAWHVLADALWHEHPPAELDLPYRLSACLSPENEHYARAHADNRRAAGCEADGLHWLERRARRAGSRPRASGPWTNWVGALEDYGRPEEALAALAEAEAAQPDSPERLSFAVAFLARMGFWERAEADLRRLETAGHRPFYLQAAVAFHRARGDADRARPLAEEWIREAPDSMPARAAALDLVAHFQGPRAAVERAAAWCAGKPGHDEFEDLYYNRLADIEADGERERLIDDRLQRNPADGWAWRERFHQRLLAFVRSADADRPARRAEIDAAETECLRTGREDAATLRLLAFRDEVLGRRREAVAGYLAAIEADPSAPFSYHRAWEAAAGLPAEERAALRDRLAVLPLRNTDRLHMARNLGFLVAARFGADEAESVVNRWRTERPDDPEVVEACVDLLLEYGRGRSDAARARVQLQDAVARFPHHVDLRFSLAHAHRLLGDPDKADACLAEISRRHPDNAFALMQRALSRERLGDPDGAQALLDEAARKAPLAPGVWQARAAFRMRRNRLTDALGDVRAGLDRLPDDGGWRDTAVALLFDIGDVAAGVDAAREGVRRRPASSHAWLRLANALQRAPEFAAPGELEEVVRRAVALDASSLEAADLLADFLCRQKRFEEAEGVVTSLRARLADPAPAGGRLACIVREQGRAEEARRAMRAVLEEAPWYAWGWDRLMDWLQADEAWAEVRDGLREVPPPMKNNPHFRRRRLMLLGMARWMDEACEREWNQLLADFPEEMPLFLQRFDILWENDRRTEAAEIVGQARALDPENPYVLARLTDVAAWKSDIDLAASSVLGIWFDRREEAAWPADHAWQAVAKLGIGDTLCRTARQRLDGGEAMTGRGLFLLTDHLLTGGRADPPKPGFFETWLPGRRLGGAEDVLAILDRQPWAEDRHRAIVLERLNERGYARRVVRYWSRNPDRVRDGVQSWGQVGYALHATNHRAVRGFLSDWRDRRGVEMWMVCNGILALLPRCREDRQEAAKACREALDGLPHDHTAKYLAHLLAALCAAFGDTDGFRLVWERHQSYFTGTLDTGEFFLPKHRNLLSDVPAAGRLMDSGSRKRLARALKRIGRRI